jgi:hypothetical protein
MIDYRLAQALQTRLLMEADANRQRRWRPSPVPSVSHVPEAEPVELEPVSEAAGETVTVA